MSARASGPHAAACAHSQHARGSCVVRRASRVVSAHHTAICCRKRTERTVRARAAPAALPARTVRYPLAALPACAALPLRARAARRARLAALAPRARRPFATHARHASRDTIPPRHGAPQRECITRVTGRSGRAGRSLDDARRECVALQRRREASLALVAFVALQT